LEKNVSVDAIEVSVAKCARQREAQRFYRGFTDHEQLNRTGFIHMNGRVYDPRIGRFVSPDPIVQNPTFSQSYNRYSYTFNSPLSYTDPSGFEAKHMIIEAAGAAMLGLLGMPPAAAVLVARLLGGSDLFSGTNTASAAVSGGAMPRISAGGSNGSVGGSGGGGYGQARLGVTTGQPSGSAESADKSWAGAESQSEQAPDPAFDNAVSKAISDVSREISAVNDRDGLLYDPNRANRPIGSVVTKEKVGVPFINRREVFVNSRPNQFVPDGLDFKGDGFIGGLHPIRNASAVVVGFPPITPNSALSDLTPSMQALSRSTGAPVFVFFTRGGFTGPFRIDAGGGP
jgi:RHS repeat-associated protein